MYNGQVGSGLSSMISNVEHRKMLGCQVNRNFSKPLNHTDVKRKVALCSNTSDQMRKPTNTKPHDLAQQEKLPLLSIETHSQYCPFDRQYEGLSFLLRLLHFCRWNMAYRCVCTSWGRRWQMNTTTCHTGHPEAHLEDGTRRKYKGMKIEYLTIRISQTGAISV